MKAEEQKGQKTKINKQMTKRYPVCYMLHNHTSFSFRPFDSFFIIIVNVVDFFEM